MMTPAKRAALLAKGIAIGASVPLFTNEKETKQMSPTRLSLDPNAVPDVGKPSVADAQKAFGAILRALGITTTGDPAKDIAAVKPAFASLLDAVDPAKQKEKGEELKLSAREIAMCAEKRMDVRAYARSKASVRRTR